MQSTSIEGLIDGLDDLPPRFEERGAGAFGLALAGGAQQREPGPGERQHGGGLESLDRRRTRPPIDEDQLPEKLGALSVARIISSPSSEAKMTLTLPSVSTKTASPGSP